MLDMSFGLLVFIVRSKDAAGDANDGWEGKIVYLLKLFQSINWQAGALEQVGVLAEMEKNSKL